MQSFVPDGFANVGVSNTQLTTRSIGSSMDESNGPVRALAENWARMSASGYKQTLAGLKTTSA